MDEKIQLCNRFITNQYRVAAIFDIVIVSHFSSQRLQKMFVEKIPTEFSENTLEDLNNLEQELRDQNSTLRYDTRHMQKQIRSNDENLQSISKEIGRRKQIEDLKVAINEELKSKLVGLLTENELSIIVKNMNRTDYRKVGDYPRWLDLDRIIDEILTIKKRYPNWELADVSKGGQYDSMPPLSFYSYEFKDELEVYISIKGIRVVNT